MGGGHPFLFWICYLLLQSTVRWELLYTTKSKPTKRINQVLQFSACSVYPEKMFTPKWKQYSRTFYWRSILTCSFKFVPSTISLAHTVLECLPEIAFNALKKKRKRESTLHHKKNSSMLQGLVSQAKI